MLGRKTPMFNWWETLVSSNFGTFYKHSSFFDERETMARRIEPGLLERLSTNFFSVGHVSSAEIIKDLAIRTSSLVLNTTPATPLKTRFESMFSGSYQISEMNPGGVWTLFQTQSGNWIPGTCTFFQDSDGVERAYLSTVLAVSGWPFDPKFQTNEVSDSSARERTGFDYSLVGRLNREIRTPIMVSNLLAGVEFYLLAGLDKKIAKKSRGELYKISRGKTAPPKPKFEIRSGQVLYMDPDSGSSHWPYFPELLEAGWVFDLSTLESKLGAKVIESGIKVLHEVIESGVRTDNQVLQTMFETPAGWGMEEHSESGLIHVSDLPEFFKRGTYDGSPNSLFWSFWGAQLASGKIPVPLALEPLIYAAQLSEDEQLIAKGNMGLAYLVVGDYVKSKECFDSVLAKEPSNSEAIFGLRAIAKLNSDNRLKEQIDKHAREYPGAEYPAPEWLIRAIDNKSSQDKSQSQKQEGSALKVDVHPELMEKLVLQVVEFARITLESGFAATFEDAEGLRPWVQMLDYGEDSVCFNIGSPERIKFLEMPWIEPLPDDELEGVTTMYLVDRASLRKGPQLEMFIGRIFESYNDIVLEIDIAEGRVPRMKTYFPVAKKPKQSKGLSSVAPAAAAAGAGYTGGYAVSFEEEQQESDFGEFDF